MSSSAPSTPAGHARFRLGRRGTFWSAALVLALSLWSSGAPSVLYPIYAAEWNLPPVVVTGVFGAYPLALLLVLLFFGGLSDAIGRRRAMLLGTALIVVAAGLFAIAPDVLWLFAARIVQGVGTGLALGAATAAMVEHNPFRNPRAASAATTASTATGLTIALVLSGALAQFAPLPLVLSYVVLALIAAVTLVALALTPDDSPRTSRADSPRAGDTRASVADGTRTSRRSGTLHLPRGAVLAFAAATLSVSVAYTVGAIFLSLGSQMARDLTGTSNLLVVGALLGVSSLAIGVTALLLGRVPAHVSIIVGGLLSLTGLAVMAAAAAAGSIALFLLWCVVGGIGYSFCFTGGLGLASRVAPEAHRGATLSLLYLVSYLLQAGTAVAAGALATALGLRAAVDIAAPALALLAVAAIVLSTADRRRTRAKDASRPVSETPVLSASSQPSPS
ncbi:MFS transporter [Herbiconiux moechotypicola]|uniref:MFS transporter n=1 Tax=Herbiconiux moechotypicola TaxID=637393 RepID=A0ABP5QWC8_9MICO|nr:MFS transporter [Herbiconiux moechotypicola]MCS5731107.1 MFS transporter [Herbiconiux moechotypicola]